ncbi:MAG: DedA family protein [Pseudonocardia sp.]|nr:DedA family protein [Pseudonocardia sp.]
MIGNLGPLVESFLEAALGSPLLLLVIVGLAVVDALLPVVPSEAMIIASGVAAAAGDQNLLLVIAAAALGSFIGETASYCAGRAAGPALQSRLPARGAATFDRVGRALDSRGGLILLTARYIPGGRTVATLAAGATSYPVPRFLAWSVLGATLSATTVALTGYLGGRAFAGDTVAALLFSLGLGLVLTVVMESGRRLLAARWAERLRSAHPR